MVNCETRNKINAVEKLTLVALHPSVMGTPTVTWAGPVLWAQHLQEPTCTLHKGWATGLGKEFVVGVRFFPLFSELNFLMRVLFLKCRWGTSTAGLNTVVFFHCRLSFHQPLASTAKTWHSLWRCSVKAVSCLGSWCLNKISSFLEDAKGVKAMVG